MYDPSVRRRSVRKGRERGSWVYIPAEVLERAGIDAATAPPRYRTWPGRRRTVLVQLYPEPTTEGG